MEVLKPNDGTVYVQESLYQNGIGGFELQTMSYTGSDGQVHTCFSVEIRSWKEEQTDGWGKKIFDGSLEDAIDVFRAGLQAQKEANLG